MKRIILFPIWNVDELEKKLCEFEKKGYRVTNIKYSYIFLFNEVKANESDYFISYAAYRDESMIACERYVNGNKVQTNLSYYSLYRIDGNKDIIQFIRGARMDYIKAVIRTKLLFFFVFFLLLLIFLILNIDKMTCNQLIFDSVFLLIFLLFTAYYLFGYIKQIKKCKTGSH